MTGCDANLIDDWIFDLDNTLYPPQAALFDQIDAKMTGYIMDRLQVDRARADHLRAYYWQLHGTTLAGLMVEHDVDPDDFLHHVHDICLANITPDPDLAQAIGALRGRKIIHTNGSRQHANQVLTACGLIDVFDEIYGVDDVDLHPKPKQIAFDVLCKRANITPQRAAMVEDTQRNLLAPYNMGMQTIHVGPPLLDRPHHVMYSTDNLTQFLRNTAKNKGGYG